MKLRSVLMGEAGDGDAGGGDPVFDDAPSMPPGKLDGALPPKPVKPKAEPEPEKPAEKPKPKSQQEKRNAADDAAAKLEEQLAAEKAKAKKDGKDKPKVGEAKPKDDKKVDDDEADKPEPRAAKPKDAPAAKPKPEPKDESPKPDPQLESRLVRAMQDLRNAESVTKQLKTEKEQHAAKVAELEKAKAKLESTLARAKDKKTAYAFFHETTGLTLKDLVDGLEAGDIAPAQMRAALPPELQDQIEKQQAELERLKKVEEERETRTRQEAEQAEQRQRFDTHLKQTKDWLQENLDEFPVLSRIPWAAQQVLNSAYKQGGQLAPAAKALQESLVGDLSLMLDDDLSLNILDEKLTQTAKERIAKKWGLKLADNDNDEEDEPEVDEDEEDDDEEERKVAVKPHKRKPASRVSNESTPRPKTKGMDKHERAAYANSVLEKFMKQQKAAQR